MATDRWGALASLQHAGARLLLLAPHAHSDAGRRGNHDPELVAVTEQQASEKVWVSVAHTLKQIAEKHGWPHQYNAELSRLVDYMAAIPGNEDLTGAYRDARSLHTNFYENEYSMRSIEDGQKRAEAFVRRLREVDRQLDGGALPPNGATSPDEYAAGGEGDEE